MVEDNLQSTDVGSEEIRVELYDNTSQRLERHIYTNSQGEYEYDVADFILKKTGYNHTYMTVLVTGVPDGVILKLCDENNNQLYSPVDTNKHWTTTACSITVGETDVIPLPAQFNNQLSNHTPFPVGTYNWKLIFAGNDYYEGKEVPLTVEIRDFKVWDIQTPTIFPNENIQVKIQTHVNTLYPSTIDMSPLLTENATYNRETGAITYPNSDINDLTIGKHMQVINQTKKCFIDYEVKNPFYILIKGNTSLYKNNGDYSFVLKCYQSDSDVTSYPTVYINNTQITQFNGGIMSPYPPRGRGYKIPCDNFPPGTYQIKMTGQYNNTGYYTAFNEFEITTEQCTVSLTLEENNIIKATYLYDNTTPIPNARVDIVEIDTNSIVCNGTTDSNGQIQMPYANGIYKAIVKDKKTNEDLLYSEVLSLNTPYLNNVAMSNDGELLLTYGNGNGIDNISINNDGDLILTLDNEITNIITDVNIAENGELYYKRK